MDQQIFNMDLSVETISVYLLCCHMADMDEAITTSRLNEIWNGTPAELDIGLRALEEKNILAKIISDGEAKSVYQIRAVRHWKR